MKTRFRYLALALCIAMMALACAPAYASTVAEAIASIPVEYECKGAFQYDLSAEVNNGEDISIEFWVWADIADLFTKFTDEYSRIHPNVTFNISTSAFADHFQKLPIAMPNGTGPDMFSMHNQFTQVLVPHMEPLPEDKFPLELLDEDYLQIYEHLIDGKLFYFDIEIMTAGIFYNTDMWEAAGLTEADIPQDWDKFVEVAKALTQFDDGGRMTVAGFNMNEYMQFLLNAMAFQEGIFMFDESGTRAQLNMPEYVENATFLRDLYEVEQIGDIKFPSMYESFGTAKAAMVYTWGWVGGVLGRDYPGINFGFFPTPRKDGGIPAAYDRNNGDSTPGVSAYTSDEKKAVCMDYIHFIMANDNFGLMTAFQQYAAPSKRYLLEHPLILGDVGLAGQAGILPRTFWPGPAPDQYFSGIQRYIGDEIMINGMDPAEALAKAEEQINKDLEAVDFVSVERLYAHADEFVK